MKTLAVCLMAGLMILAGGTLSLAHSDRHLISYKGECQFNNVDFDLEDGTIILTRHGRHRETVEITEEYELYVNGDRVELNDDQRQLVGEFHRSVMDIVDYAKTLGWEGAKIGAEGAKLGLQALGGLFKVIFTSYETEDFERDIEREAERIEARAERLEKKAELIEEMAEDLEDLAYDLQSEIPELRELDWL